MNFNKLIVILTLFPVAFVGNAQDDLNKTVHVTTAYDPIISDAEKIELSVNLNDTLFRIKNNYIYSVNPQDIASSLTLRPVPAAEIRENAYKDPKWLYARLGTGFPLQFLGDLYLQNIKPEDIAYGGFYNHRSLWAEIPNPDGDKIPIDELNHRAGAYLRKNFDNMSFNLNGGFDQRSVLFYGYNTAEAKRAGYVFNRDSLAQSYTSINLAARINSVNSKNFFYDIDLALDLFGDNGSGKFNTGRMFSMNENRVGANIFLGTLFGEGKHLFSLKIDGNLFLRELSYNKKYDAYFIASNRTSNQLFTDLYGLYGSGHDISDNAYILNVSPMYGFTSKLIDIELGLKYTGHAKNSGFKNRLYPVAGIQFKIANEFVPFASISGATVMNDYKSIVSENPYIVPGMNMAMKSTNHSYIITGGAKGNIDNVLAYNVYGKYSLMNDYYLFKNSSTSIGTNSLDFTILGNNFTVVNDDIQLFNAGVELKFLFNPVEIMFSGAYYYCILDKAATVYQLPAKVAGLNVNVAATKELKLNFTADYRSEIAYAYVNATNEVLCDNKFVNLGLGAEYLINKNFSVFANAVNLLNNKNGYWHGYKLPGAGVFAGITFKL